MQLTHLKVNNFRGFEQAELEFKLGMNLLVGINGAGKSSILDLLRILLSRFFTTVGESKTRPLSLSESDHSFGSRAITAELGFMIQDIYDPDLRELADFRFTLHKNLEQYIPSKKEGNVRSQGIYLPDLEALHPNNKEIIERLRLYINQNEAVYYSTRRSSPTLAKQTKSNDSLLHRDLNLRAFANWWLVQESDLDYLNDKSLTSLGHRAQRNLLAMEAVVNNFLDGCHNVRAIKEPEATLLVDKRSKTLDVRQLSDGERGILALAFDLARRITDSMGFSSDNPLEEAHGVILIDEIDLHLHPRWQREIVQKLTNTFPKCQFIATTHSPQVVGEVPPENITILEAGKPPYAPDQALGMDTNWILEFLMDTRTRNEQTQQELDHVSELIEEEKYAEAQSEIDRLSQDKLARDPELIRLQTRLDRLKILREDDQEE
jgi:predicted ATP-binding protein involved in virulence